jgi:predicted DNA-binding transcriptional regulator AlpA
MTLAATGDHEMQPLLTQDECAELMKLSVRTVERLRITGAGPKFLRIRHSVRYRPADVEAWLASRTVRSTSEENAQ